MMQQDSSWIKILTCSYSSSSRNQQTSVLILNDLMKEMSRRQTMGNNISESRSYLRLFAVIQQDNMNITCRTVDHLRAVLGLSASPSLAVHVQSAPRSPQQERSSRARARGPIPGGRDVTAERQVIGCPPCIISPPSSSGLVHHVGSAAHLSCLVTDSLIVSAAAERRGGLDA